MSDVRNNEHAFRERIAAAVFPHIWHFSNLNKGAVVSTADEDTKLSFDMRVGMWLPVSVRLRGYKYFGKYRDFSVRSKTPYSGTTIKGELVTCELDKLKNGHGNCYFYGWLSPCERDIAAYMIVDINRLRPHLARGVDKPNYDRKTGKPDGTMGRYFALDQLSDIGALVYQSWDEDEIAA